MTTATATDDRTHVMTTPGNATKARRPTPMAGLVAMLTLVLVATAVYFGLRWKTLDDLDSARDEALNAARADAVAIASYDYRDIDSYFTAVQGITTGDFAQQYTKSDSQLRKLLTKSKSIVEASVLNAGIESATETRVVVLIFIDQSVSNVATQGEATDRNRMRLTMTRVGDRWLVSGLELL